jgi:DNA polymerase-3 subunit delta
MPVVDTAGLRKQIHAGTLAPVYLLFGEDVRLIEQLVDAIEATVDPGDRPFAVERVYAGEAGGSPIDIAAAANVFPMLGNRRIVIVMRAERFLKPPRRGSGTTEDTETETEEADDGGAVDLAPLEAYIDRPAPTTSLVFVAAAVDRTRRFSKRLIEKSTWLELEGLAGDNAAEKRDARREAEEQLVRELKMSGRTIDQAAVHVLVDRAGGDISKLRGDVERLLLYTEGRKVITKDDIDDVVTVETDVDDWAVVNAIGDGDVARALREAAQRFDRGDSPHQMIGQLRWWVSAQLAKGAPDRVKPALDALLRTDLALKSSGGDTRVLVERLVVELTGRPIPRPQWGPGRR